MAAKRYHTVLVVLHWLLAILMLVEVGMGSTFLKSLSNDMPEKLLALRNHMAAGNLILILTVIRFIVRLRTEHPIPITGSSAFLDRLAAFGHYGLYFLTILMGVSGLALAAETDLPTIVFDGIGSLPANFDGIGARIAHGWIAQLLILLIIGHILAAIYHQYVRKDGLLSRMGFGARH